MLQIVLQSKLVRCLFSLHQLQDDAVSCWYGITSNAKFRMYEIPQRFELPGTRYVLHN